MATTESRLQQEVFTFHWNNYPKERGLLFMVNNSASSRIQGNRFRALGMVAGVSDMIYLKPGGVPLLLELKTGRGTLSTKQVTWQGRVVANGYRYHVIRSLDEAKQVCGWN